MPPTFRGVVGSKRTIPSDVASSPETSTSCHRGRRFENDGRLGERLSAPEPVSPPLVAAHRRTQQLDKRSVTIYRDPSEHVDHDTSGQTDEIREDWKMHRDRMNEREMRGPRRRDIGHDLLAERLAEWGGGGGRGGHRRMRRGDIRTSAAGGPGRRAGPRIRAHHPARGEERGRLAAQSGVGLPHPAALRGRRSGEGPRSATASASTP
jgi:hypothetical protein